MTETVTIQRLTGVTCRLIGPKDAAILADETLIVPHPSAKFQKRYRRRGWDGMVHFYQKAKGVFPSGLAYKVSKALKKGGFKVKFDYPNLSYRPIPLDSLLGIELRSYQSRAVDVVEKSRGASIQCPTAGGKTEIGAELIRRTGFRTLWMCNGISLMYQTQQRLMRRLGVRVGVIGDGKFDLEDITVGIVNSLSRITDKDFWPIWEQLIIDEAHLGSAKTWYDCSNLCVNAYIRMNLSGTMKTGDEFRDMRAEAAAGPVVPIVTTMELADLGFVARPTVVMLRAPRESYPSWEQIRDNVAPDWRDNPQVLRPRGGELFSHAYDLGVIRNKARTELVTAIVKKHLRRKERILLACKRTYHGSVLQAAIFDARCTWLWGESSAKERETSIEKFKNTEGGAVLVASEIFKTGIDIPEIDVLILATGGKSSIDILQWCGRSMRVRPGKKTVLIYDFIDGRTTTDKRDYLGSHSKARLEEYENAGFTVATPKKLDYSWL